MLTFGGRSVKKLITFLLVLILLLALTLAAMILVPRHAMGIDIFNLSGWHETGSGAVQYRNYWGKPLTGWQNINGNWHYFSPKDGTMATGWTEIDGSHYYLDESGIRRTGWLNLADGSYYVDPDTGCAVGGWLEFGENTYYVTESGRISTGLTEIEGKLYFLGDDGKRLDGWTVSQGKRYFLTDGLITTGWTDTEFGRSYFLADGSLGCGWTDTDEGRYYLTENGTVGTGWLDTPEGRLYLDENGLPGSGLTETPQGWAWLDESGIAQTGWLERDGKPCYGQENGLLAIGKVVIEDQTWYFDSRGCWVPFVNRWNPLPEGYEVELADYGSHKIAAEALEYLKGMIDQIKGLGYYKVTSIYRSKATQQSIWDRYYNNFRAAGYKKADAERLTGEKVAIPGTSEHHLAYAVDIDGVKPVHNWLAEHSWEYGFIVRYPDGTTAITGIEYEPWHFRYVGRELAKELFDLGITLEEYMDMLTEKAGNGTGTASNPETAQ